MSGLVPLIQTFVFGRKVLPTVTSEPAEIDESVTTIAPLGEDTLGTGGGKVKVWENAFDATIVVEAIARASGPQLRNIQSIRSSRIRWN